MDCSVLSAEEVISGRVLCRLKLIVGHLSNVFNNPCELIPAAVPPDNYLIPLTNKRQIRPKRSEDFRTTNTVDRSVKNIRCYVVETTKTVIF